MNVECMSSSRTRYWSSGIEWRERVRRGPVERGASACAYVIRADGNGNVGRIQVVAKHEHAVDHRVCGVVEERLPWIRCARGSAVRRLVVIPPDQPLRLEVHS